MGKVNTTDRVKKLIPVLGAMTSKELLTVMSLASGYAVTKLAAKRPKVSSSVESNKG